MWSASFPCVDMHSALWPDDRLPVTTHFFFHSKWDRDTQEITRELEMRAQREEINRKPICYMKNLVQWCGLLRNGERNTSLCSWEFLYPIMNRSDTNVGLSIQLLNVWEQNYLSKLMLFLFKVLHVNLGQAMCKPQAHFISVTGFCNLSHKMMSMHINVCQSL